MLYLGQENVVYRSTATQSFQNHHFLPKRNISKKLKLEVLPAIVLSRNVHAWSGSTKNKPFRKPLPYKVDVTARTGQKVKKNSLP